MTRARIFKSIFYFALLGYLSYLCFFAFQGTLEAVSKVGDKLCDYLGCAMNVFLLPALAVYLCRDWFEPIQNSKRFHLSHGIALIVLAFLSLGFMLYATIIYRNWFFGPTWLYPLDFLLIDFATLGLGVHSLLKSKKEMDTGKTENRMLHHLFAMVYGYLFVALAMDRIGALFSSLFTTSGISLLYLLPVYLLCLVPMGLMVGSFLYSLQPTEKRKRKIHFWFSLSGLVLSALALLYIVIMLYSSVATPFMKMISPFYGLDRLSSLPITLMVTSLMPLFTSLACFIQYFFKKS